MAPMNHAEAAPASAGAAPLAAAAERPIDYHQWTRRSLRRGQTSGLAVAKNVLHIPDSARGTRERRLGGTTYETGTWVSPWRRPGFALTQLVPSWSARTPGRQLPRGARARPGRGRAEGFVGPGRAVGGRGRPPRAHVVRRPGRRPGVGRRRHVGHPPTAGLEAYQLRVTLARRVGQARTPRLATIGAMTSRLPSGAPATSRPGRVRGEVLDVPRSEPDDPPRPLPPVGRRGRGLVQPHRHLDGARLLRRPAAVAARRPGSRKVTRTPRSTTPPATPSTTPTRAPATGRSTPPTPPRGWASRRPAS